MENLKGQDIGASVLINAIFHLCKNCYFKGMINTETDIKHCLLGYSSCAQSNVCIELSHSLPIQNLLIYLASGCLEYVYNRPNIYSCMALLDVLCIFFIQYAQILEMG